LPCDRKMTRSHTACTSCMLCEVHRMPQRSCVARFLIFSRMSCAADGSKDAVGSSSNSSFGLFTSAFASAARVCSPDDSSPHLVWRKCARSNSSRSSSTRCRKPLIPYSSPKKRKFSATVKLPGSAAYTAAKLVPARARARCFARSISPISTSPLVGCNTPSIMLMVVVLPAPFGPSRPTISPGFTVNESSSSATIEPYVLRRLTARSAMRSAAAPDRAPDGVVPSDCAIKFDCGAFIGRRLCPAPC
jgi:hypothetical protein